MQGIFTINWMRNEIGECLLEDINGDFRKPLRLEIYLKRHKELVGRDWLFNLTEHNLQNMNASKNGLVLEADMGYGKSAFVVHTVCAGKNSQGHRLREMLVAFHLCKFDVILTKKPGVFIQRLASMISHFIPELMDTLKMDGQCFTHYRGELCNEDPLGCTDSCLIHPLEKLIERGFKPSAVKVILIDAIDECAKNNDADDNAIFEVIRKKFHLFPNWIKLLMTSRRSKQIVRLLPDFDVISLRSKDERNLRDIQSYLNNTNDKILEQTASFIIAKHMVESNNFTEGNLRNLNRFYEDQFERIFGKEFVLAKIILEVTATTFWTKTKRNIIKIITKTSTVDERRLNNEFEKVEHFFIIENDTFSFNHHSVVEWLETTSAETYRISRANGHKINAMYLLNVIATGRNIVIDVVDLAIHLMNCENLDESIDQFKNITLEQRRHMEINFSESPLIRCVKRTDCSNIPSVLYFYFNNTEELSSENFTAAYIAASTGKLSALKSLCDHGADVNFRVKSYHGTKLANVQVATLIKQWGYGLLDIAAQNGHVRIVNFILTGTRIFGNYTHHILNGFNLKPVHLACKYGCVVTVKEFYRHNKEIVDWLCLYFASDGGHFALVSYLVNELNITDEFRECNKELTCLPKGSFRMQGREVEIVSPFDEWGNLSCESALHAAIREDHIDIMKSILSSDGGSTLTRLDRRGGTPLITAFQTDRSEIVKYIIEQHYNLVNRICGIATGINDKRQLNQRGKVLLKGYECQSSLWLQKIIAGQNLRFDDNEEALEFFTEVTTGCLPAHFAACSGNIQFLQHQVFDQMIDIFALQCDNKYTPLHSAIACQNITSFDFIVDQVPGGELYLKSERSSFFWFAIKESPFILKESTKQPLSDIIVKFLSRFPDLLNETDGFGRNPLHFLIQNGHTNALNWIIRMLHGNFDILIQRKDMFGQTPIMYAVRLLKKQYGVSISLNNFKTDVHIVKRAFTQSESSIITCLQRAHTQNISRSYSEKGILKLLVKNQLFEFFHTFVFEILYDQERCQPEIFYVILKNDLHGFFVWYYFIKRNKLSDGQILQTPCPLHKIIEKRAYYAHLKNQIQTNAVLPRWSYFVLYLLESVRPYILKSCEKNLGRIGLDVAIDQKSVFWKSLFQKNGLVHSFPLFMNLNEFKDVLSLLNRLLDKDLSYSYDVCLQKNIHLYGNGVAFRFKDDMTDHYTELVITGPHNFYELFFKTLN
ncbi:protein TANC2-like [Mya arenaria]|uniref:protein TANC2-like n=1 Tax=Mya arenaria TaxID=6604 RepID=UPI0022DEB731|nr:protein TANC2-like [Mya arenaria]